MRKKSLLLLLLMALFMPWAAQAQTRETLTFDFEDQTIPSTWTNDATYPWVVTDAAANAGTYSIKSGNSGVNSSTSTITATYTFAGDGSISFAVRCSSEQTNPTYDWDYGTFYIDGVQQGSRIINSTTFSTISYDVEAGEHTFMWIYKKDSSVGSNDDCLYVDDIVIDLGVAASTPKPTGLAVSEVTDNSAKLSWTENGTATSWQLCINGDEDNPTTINTNPYTLTNLTATTAYTVKVRSVGNGEYSAWSNEVSFSTTAVAVAVGDAWSDDFEGETCGWELVNGTLTNQWCWGTATNNGGTHALYISNDGGTTNAYTNSSAAMVYATKLLNFADGKYEFSYDWMANGEGGYDYLRVALVPATVTLTAGTSYPTGFGTTGLPTGWIALDGGSKLNLATTWQSKSATINVTAGNYYLVMAWRDDTSGGTNPPAAVDNVSISKITCDQDVTNLVPSFITTNSATLNWEGGEATQWQVAYGTASNFEGATEVIVDDNTYDMTGLQSSTVYYVRVRAYCGGEDFGSWSSVISFATACGVIDALGYSENFDDYTAATGMLPNCWNRINEGTNTTYNQYPYIYGSSANSPSNCLRFYAYGTSGTSAQYAILPEMEGLNGKQIVLQARGYNNDNAFKIGMMTDPTDATTFVEIASQTLTTSYQEFEFILGEGNYVAILMEAPTGSTTVGVYVDDIVIREAPTCAKPTNLTFVSATTTTATFSWTSGANETAWQIMLNDDEENLIMADNNQWDIEGLTAATTYTAKVRAYCDAEDQSDWSNEVSFTTACEAISDLPWNENFDAYTGSTSSSAPTGYPNNEMPTCWQFLNRSDNSTTYPQVFISSNIGYPVSGNCLFFKSSSSTPLYAVLPEFEEDIAGLQLTFTYRNEGTSASNGTLIVGYMTNPADATTFTAVQTCEITTTLTEMEVPFTSAPAGSYMAFMYQGGSSNNYYLSIDNVSVDYIPTCAKPTDLTFVSATTTTATLSWTSGANETAWQIMLNDDEENLIMAENNQWVIEGLTASTAYTAKVRAYCSADDQSDWSNEVSFTTACDVIVVDAAHPFTEGFEGTFAPLCWESIPYVSGSSTYQWSRNSTHHTGSYAAYSGYYGPIYLVMPDLQLGTDGDAVQLTFWSYNSYVDDYDKNSVVLLDGENEIELWSPESVVNQWEETTIDLSTYMGQTISLAFKYEGSNAHGWYVDDVQVTMVKTYTLTIEGVGEENWNNENNSGYYLIASPVNVDLTNHEMTTGDFDLYYFDQVGDEDGNEWMNYKNESFNLEPGKGYLYAHKTGGEFTLTGTAYSGDGEIELVYDDNAVDFKGWNLVGNPFGEDAYINKPFYTLENSDTYTQNTVGTAIHAMQGLLVVADSDGETLTFSTEVPAGNKTAKLNMNLRRGDKQLDNAILVFGENQQLGKLSFRENSSKIYMPVEGKDYAIATAESNMGEMPVSFKAENNGSYTLSFTAEEVSFAYLHLIDNMTGIETDLLANPSYNFEARTTDYANRFKLVFATGNADDDFAFFSNGSFVINNEGIATVQVIDVNGRIISSESINGCANVNVKAATGVYMIRLVNGDNVKVQKVVVK